MPIYGTYVVDDYTPPVPPTPPTPNPTVSRLLPDDLELYLKLDGNANDSSPNARHGTPTGIDWTPNGKILQAAQTIDVGDKIVITGWKGLAGTGGGADPDSIQGRTVSFWQKFPWGASPRNETSWIYWGTINTSNWFNIYTRNVSWGIGQVIVSFFGHQVYANTNLAGDTDWHHVCVTVPTGGYLSDVKIYVDNAEDTPYTVSSDLQMRTKIGSDVTIVEDFQSQHTDELGIWSRDLTVEQVGWLWNNGNGLPYD
jgi:hypothetical protein